MLNPSLDFLNKFVLEDDDETFNLIKRCLQNSMDPICAKLLNKDGSPRKRNRTDYSRTPKLPKLA